MVREEFTCNDCTEDAIKWLKEKKHLINDGGTSNTIIIEVVHDELLK